MKSALRPIRAQSRPICQLCDHILQQPGYRRSFIAASTLKAPSIRRDSGRRHGVPQTISTRRFASARQTQIQPQELEPEIELLHETLDNPIALNRKLQQVEADIEAICASPRIESEEVVQKAFQGIITVAVQAIAIRAGKPPKQKLNLRQSSAGAILNLDSDAPPTSPSIQEKPSRTLSFPNELPTPAYLSNLAVSFLKHEKVFISPSILAAYVDLQRLLGRPRAIPEILHLYANKPVPQEGSSPPKYSKPSPKGHKQAIPPAVASKALDAAIAAKDLDLALKMIDTTYCAPAWRSYKILTKVVPPGLIATATPLALYMIAQEFSVYSNLIDPWIFKWYSFFGLLTYVTCTGTLGFVAMTTANDHFVRIVWRPGMPLLDRWLREDERAALDKIACAWGFKETWKYGDEEGEEWEGLKKWVMLRGMILDKADQMPGMNA